MPPADPPFRLWATVDHAASLGPIATTNIWFGVSAPAERFVIPPVREPWRKDELWKTTCFEAFFAAADADGYREWNFAPRGNWAAYDFTGYRVPTACGATRTQYTRSVSESARIFFTV